MSVCAVSHMIKKRVFGRCDMRLCELQEKDVINVADCRCLGNVCDLDLDDRNGCIRALIVPQPGKWFGNFCREFEYFIPWNCIVRIGPDIILVDICLEDARHKL